MKTNDIKQIMVTRFEKPIDEVLEAFDMAMQDYSEVPIDTQSLGFSLDLLQKRLTNLKALLPTLQ